MIGFAKMPGFSHAVAKYNSPGWSETEPREDETPSLRAVRGSRLKKEKRTVSDGRALKKIKDKVKRIKWDSEVMLLS